MNPFPTNPCYSYTSTRGGTTPVPFDQAVLQGFARDGGLFVPQALPRFSPDEFKKMAPMAYTELAVYILSRFIDPKVMPQPDLKRLVRESFAPFNHPEIIPVKPCPLHPDIRIMELFHGPTLSFKDIAMGFLVRVMDYFLARKNQRLNLILATTGDTGPAAAHAAAGLSTMDCWPLFPKGMITLEQEVQMTGLTAPNIHPVGVENCPDGGDDLDRVVLALFRDADLKNRLKLSSVNSINWCRVMVQSVHYFYGYFRACPSIGAPLVFSVPSGAFGNLFAGFLAREMGLPVHEFICSVNANQTLHRVFTTGIFKNEDLIPTCSSAIDIVLPYNFWRFLYFAAGCDAGKIKTWMDQFQEKGEITLDRETLEAIQSGFISTSISDRETLDTIQAAYEASPAYLLDPHGAVAVAGARNRLDNYPGGTPILCMATAHPAKFPDIITRALAGRLPPEAVHTGLDRAKKGSQRLETVSLETLGDHLTDRIGAVKGGSVAEYTRLTDDDLNTLLAFYDIGRLRSAVPMAGGQANSSFKLITDTGCFTLSVCDEKTAEEIKTLTRVLGCLADNGFPATRLKQTRTRRRFVEFKGKPVYVKEFLEGEVLRNLTGSMLSQVGQAMAGLHGIAPPPELPKAFPYGMNQFDEVLDSNISHPFVPWLQKKKDRLESALNLTMVRGFIHGDIFWDNLLFEQETLAAILDFEEACEYYLLYDLGMACVGCCAGDRGFDFGKIDGLLSGYQAIRPLSDTEKKQFRHFLVYAATAAAFWRFRQYNIRYPDPDKADNYKELALLADQAETQNFLV